MARKRKPVDNAPIGDPAYIRRIDPVWISGPAPKRFWEDRRHRSDYLLWLGSKLRFRRLADYYRLELSGCFAKYGGGGLIRYWGCSALTAVQDCYPNCDWKPWLFGRIPLGFWESRVNRRNYMEWLGKELGFRRPKDWFAVQTEDFVYRHGAILLRRYPSLIELMREYLPKLDWDGIDRHRPIRCEQVLAWADAHYARHGKWPVTYSGAIPGTRESWSKINDCLREGHRGLLGGTDLGRFLNQHRGAPAGRTRPELSEEQILAWADAYFAAHQKWPTKRCGKIPGAGQTWGSVAQALRGGFRKLPGGTSLAQLLAERRGVPNRLRVPRLTEKRIVALARLVIKETGQCPNVNSGPVAQSPGDTWMGYQRALLRGNRGLPGGSSLAKLLCKHGLRK